MPSYRMPGLSEEDASRVCMEECKAICCRGPLVLRLDKDEVQEFSRLARDLGVELVLRDAPEEAGWVRFSDYAGERCPMLDGVTWACRIYKNRPTRCREFPQGPIPGCAISGG